MPKRQHGLTLIELLAVIALTAITAAVALPDMSRWLAVRRTAAQADQLATMLNFARSEAARLNLPVYICPVQIKKDGQPDKYCNQQYAGQGLTAFADTDNNRIYTRKTDVAVRTVAFNIHNNEPRTRAAVGLLDFSGRRQNGDNVWVYLPDGSFGHAAGIDGTFSFSDGVVQIALTDFKAKNLEEKQMRSSVVLIDSSGRVQVCGKSGDNPMCRYSEES